MTILAQSNWDAPGLVLGPPVGVPKPGQFTTLVPMHCRIETPPVPSPNGTLAVHAFCPAGAAVNVQLNTQLPQAPDLVGGAGWFVEWDMLMTAATLAHTALHGQIKTFLARAGLRPDGTTDGFVVLGEGEEWALKNNRLAAAMDFQGLHFGDGPVITPDAWHRIGLWMQRDPVAHLGHAKVWFDGKIVGARGHPMLGSDNGTRPRGLSFGDVFTQHAAPGAQLDVWTSNVTVANAPIADYMQAAA